MIYNEKDVLSYLRLPSLPKKSWDGKTSFRNCVAVVRLSDEDCAYAVASFDEEKDDAPRITKVFSQEPFFEVIKVLLVPEYMDVEDIQNADLDDESKKRAKELAEEAKEIENEGVESETDMSKLPEWIFDHIKNRDEAEAYLKSYRKTNKIKGAIPKTEENLKLALYVIYTEMQNKTK